MDDDVDGDRLRSLISSWNEEQKQIASRVIVPPDASTTTSFASKMPDGRHTGRFKLVHPPPPPPPPPSSTITTTTSSNSSSSSDDDARDDALLVGGVDVHYHHEGDLDMAVAAYVILRYDVVDASAPPRVVHRSHRWYRPAVPYVPSYLAYREADPLIELINEHRVAVVVGGGENECEKRAPSVILVDGNGMWHERGAGLACVVGVRTGLPTVGVGKGYYGLKNDGAMTKRDVRVRSNDALFSWHDEMREVNAYRRDDERIGDEGVSAIATNRCLVLDTAIISSNVDDDGKGCDVMRTKEIVPVGRILEALHRFAYGIAIPMKGRAINDDDDNNNDTGSGGSGSQGEDEPLAYALVGHGGNDVIHTSSKDSSTRARRGSINPIYISVGSNISLLDAVNLCSRLCVTRIPEPIREADLYCRRLVRER
ncbi:hypothetical protein ACHAXA_010427 [Cyclostephanos tholiformis]|uniref:Uncharacterized protein n=1 Tax=Cyclostephanos tholiformis TaxID=382380 RepID=A0ABD3R255_9STRA